MGHFVRNTVAVTNVYIHLH